MDPDKPALTKFRYARSMTLAPTKFRFFDGRTTTTDFNRMIGLIAGFGLPVIAALLYRTYHVAVASQGLETTRQLGFVYLAGEMLVLFHARHCGLDLTRIVRAMPIWAQLALTLFLATFWISSVFVSHMVPFSLGLSLGWVVHLLFAASLYHLATSATDIDPRAIANGFVAGLAALAVFIALHFAAAPDALFGRSVGFFTDPVKIDLGSAIPGFISSRLFGSWCGAVLALLTGIAWRCDDTRGWHRLYMMLALAFCLTVWTATRAALLGWGVCLPIAWLLAGPPASRTVYTRLPIYLLAATVLALMLPPYGDGQFTFFRGDSMGSADAMATGRLTLWTNALHVAANYPLLGSGAGSSWWMVPLNGFYHVQPHNALVQFVLNWGLIPTIPALVLIVGATWKAHSNAKIRPALLPLILMLDCLLAMSMLDGMMHFAQFIMLIFGCLAISLAHPRLKTPDRI